MLWSYIFVLTTNTPSLGHSISKLRERISHFQSKVDSLQSNFWNTGQATEYQLCKIRSITLADSIPIENPETLKRFSQLCHYWQESPTPKIWLKSSIVQPAPIKSSILGDDNYNWTFRSSKRSVNLNLLSWSHVTYDLDGDASSPSLSSSICNYRHAAAF
jgi:hypothetical protein